MTVFLRDVAFCIYSANIFQHRGRSVVIQNCSNNSKTTVTVGKSSRLPTAFRAGMSTDYPVYFVLPQKYYFRISRGGVTTKGSMDLQKDLLPVFDRARKVSRRPMRYSFSLLFVDGDIGKLWSLFTAEGKLDTRSCKLCRTSRWSPMGRWCHSTWQL